MTNREIDHIIACEIDRMTKAADPFIRKGYMGMCVFLFKMYEFTADNKYYDLAQEMLSRACSSLRRRSKVNMIDGLSGIGSSIMRFHKKGYVTGNIYEILRNIDDEIYKSITQAIDCSNDFSTQGHEEALMDSAFYMTERMKSRCLPLADNKIHKLFICKIINKLYQDHDCSFYLEPIPISGSYNLAHFILLLCDAYSAEIERSRIIHIWKEMRNAILAQAPFYDCNKLSLCYAFEQLRSIFPHDNKLKNISLTFKKDISIANIVNEFPANAMSMLSGLPGTIRLLQKMRTPLTKAEVYSLKEKLKASDYYLLEYEKISEDQFVGYNGILGFITAYLSLKKPQPAL